MPVDIDPTRPFQVFPYTVDRLAAVFAAASNTREDTVRAKSQFDYFKSYFAHFEEGCPLTILVEWKYTDRDFLEDYAAYYVRCFQNKYSSICARLHFFRMAFNESQVRAAVAGDAPDLLTGLQNEDRYLGFIVVKPLPQTFIGRTCLKTYEDCDPRRRYFPVTRPYAAHVLGLDLKVVSLAFQEQDTVAAACATSALWSTFQGTALLFQHEIRSPVEITRIATEQAPGLQRDVPNRGLTPLQMAVAIKKTGLEPEVIGTGSADALQATAHAYLSAGIPIVMNTALYDVSRPSKPRPLDGHWDSGHAVVVTGYSRGLSRPTQYVGTGTLLTSSRIDKLYVHDDQIGPFARIEFGAPAIDVAYKGRKKKVSLTLRSSWRGDGGKGDPGTVLFGPEALIIPLYHKIRIRFDTILECVLKLDRAYRSLAAANTHLPKTVEWDIYLTTEDAVKHDVRKAANLRGDERWRILERPLPRFVWRATAWAFGARVIDFLFDATDVDQGDLLIDSLGYDI